MTEQIETIDINQQPPVHGYANKPAKPRTGWACADDCDCRTVAASNGSAPQFPINHILLSGDNTSPDTWLGYGTWALVGQGKVLIGAGGAYAGGDTPGAATHAHSFTQPDAHTDHAALSHSAHAGADVSAPGVTQPAAHSNHVFTQPGAHTFTQPAAHGAISSHSGATVGTSGAGSAHTHTQGAVTQPTIAWPAGVPTASGTAVANPSSESAHTHTSASAPATPKLFTSNTSTGVGELSGGGTAHTHTQGAVTQPTVSWPAGVPTATLSAVANPANESAHTHAAGTVGQASDHSALTNNHSGGGVDAHSGGAVDAHSAHSGTAVDAHSAHAGTAVANHTITQANAHTDHAAQSHSAHAGGAVADGSNLPPSLAVYFFKRTA